MRRTLLFALTAVTAALFVNGGSAGAAAWCGGQYDFNCDYYGGDGRVHHCYAWVGFRCQDPSVTVSGPGGTCNGGVDVGCSDGGVNCTVWISSTGGCLIGL